MKKVITTIALVTICLISQISCFASGCYTYTKSMNPFIEVGVSNVSNSVYSIIGPDGKVVQSGIIATNTILKIKTSSLKKGSYYFVIDGSTIQQFNIK